MARPCSICCHERKLAIEKQIVRGVALAKIAEQFDVGRSALDRHKRIHMAVAIKRAAARERLHADGILDDLLTLRASLVAVARKAEANRSWAGATQALTSAVRASELLARITGVMEGEKTTVNVLAVGGDDWPALRSRILAALEAHPEARADVVAALAGDDRPALPADVVDAEAVEVLE